MIGAHSLNELLDASLTEAIHSSNRVGGYTHGFYRYPAAASPEMIGVLIDRFTKSGDWILDPFMGGGTTIVEALAAGRRAIGIDINPLSVFVTNVKTRPLPSGEWQNIFAWLDDVRSSNSRETHFSNDPRFFNFPEELRAAISPYLHRIDALYTSRQKAVVRCALLRAAQWSLESRDRIPSSQAFAQKLTEVVSRFQSGMNELVQEARVSKVYQGEIVRRRKLLSAPASEAIYEPDLRPLLGNVSLILTSPPYPGVHVLYHRWQVRSRKETAAPYWITNLQDGAGSSYYAMGSRTPTGESNYFSSITRSFSSLRPFLKEHALVCQVVAFNDTERHLPEFLAAMAEAGYTYLGLPSPKQLVRKVPNRRWYVRGKQHDAAKEHLLLFSLTD